MSSITSSPASSTQANTLAIQLRSGVIWLGSTTLLRQIITWGLTLITARVLLPTDYGVMALVEAALPYLMTLCSLGAGVWLVQEQHIDRKIEQEIFGLALITGGIAAVLCLLLAPLVADAFDMPVLVEPFRLLAVVFVAKAFSAVPDALLRRNMDFKPMALGRLIIGILQGLLTLGLALMGLGFWALVWGTVFGQCALSLFFIKVQGLPGWPRFSLRLYRKVLGYGIAISAAGICFILFSTMDDVIVGKLFGAQVLGFYSMAYFLSEMPLAKLNQVLQPVLISYFGRLKEDLEEMERVLLKLNRGLMGLLAPLFFGIIAIAPEAVLLVLGEKWAPMATPLRVMSGAALFKAMFSPIPTASSALGHGNPVFLYSFITAIVLVPSFFITSYLWGLNGIFISWILIYPAICAFNVALFARTSGFSARRYLSNFSIPVTVSAGMCVAVLLFREVWYASPLLDTVLIEIVFGGLVYVTALVLIFPSYTRECCEVLSSIRRPT